MYKDTNLVHKNVYYYNYFKFKINISISQMLTEYCIRLLYRRYKNEMNRVLGHLCAHIG